MVTRREFLVRSMGTTALFLAGACSTAPAAAPPAPAGGPAPAGSNAPAAGKPSGGLKTVRLAVQGPFLPLAAPFIAKRKGYFEEAGVDVSEVKLAPGGTTALVAGELDIMVGGGSDVMLLADKNETATAIVGLVRGMQLHLEVRPDVAQQRGVTPNDPLDKRLAAMKGMTLSVTAPTTAPDVVLDFMIRQAKLQPSDVTKQFINTQPAQLAALEQRQIDGIVGGPPLTESLVINGQGVILIRGPELEGLGNIMYETAFGMKSWVDSHPDEAKGVAQALMKATQFMANDPDAAAFLSQTDFSSFSVEVLNASLDKLRSGLPTDGKATRAEWEGTMKFASAAGLLNKTVNIDEGTYWTNKYVG